MKVSRNISKIIIPAAGLGTRFLPFTKAIPKELLPLINKPALQEVVEEGIASGINNFYLIVNKDKAAIREYFTRNTALDAILAKHKKLDRIKEINEIIDTADFHYIEQPQMRGLGDAIFRAKEAMANESFGVILPDDIIVGDQPGMQQLMHVAKEHNAIVVAVMEVPPEQISAYGSIKPGSAITKDILNIVDIIEKPKPEKAFSYFGIIGRYIFTPAIFDAIATIAPQATGEIQLTDAIAHLAQSGHKVVAYVIKGRRFDLGRPPGWLEANLYLGMHSKKYGQHIRSIIKNIQTT